MTTLLIDGVVYKLWTPQEEGDLEEIVKEHTKDIFGEDSIYFERRKISSELGIRSIPDGFAINFRSKKLYAIEIELSTHSYDHIVSQGNRHIDAINNLATKHKLVKGFNNEIKSDPYKKLFTKKFVEEDLHDFLTSISENPELVIIADGVSNDIKQAQRALNSRMKTKIIEFKTFEREDVDLRVHAHSFEPMIPTVPPEPTGPEHLTLEYHRDYAGDQTKEIFDELRERILELGEDVKEGYTPEYVKYFVNTTFVALHVRKNWLILHLRVDESSFKDPKKIAKDISHLGWSTTRQLKVTDKSEIPYAMQLIKQAYEYQ